MGFKVFGGEVSQEGVSIGVAGGLGEGVHLCVEGFELGGGEVVARGGEVSLEVFEDVGDVFGGICKLADEHF